MAMRLSVIIPCYNEGTTLRDTIERVEHARLLSGWEREIIVIDDGSSDTTSSILRSLEGENRVRALRHAHNKGKGAAVKTGLSVASGDYVLVQDADNEYDPADYAALIAALEKDELVFGSRNLGSNNVPYNAVYFYGGLLVTKLFNLLFGTRLSDIASCYKLFPRRFIPELLKSDHNDFVFDAVVLTRALTRESTIAEVPISYRARGKREGKKLNARHATKIVAALILSRFGLGGARSVSFVAQIMRFLIAGGSAAIINVVTLYLFTEFAHIWYLYSSILAFTIAFAFSFSFQKYWVFRSDDYAKIPTQLPLHLGVALGNLALNTILLFLLVEYVHLWYVLAQLVASALIGIESFIAFRWIFR